MKKLSAFLFCLILIAINSFAQINFDEVNVENWFGNGSNEAVLVVDFDSDPIGVDSVFAWGINFDSDSISGEEILSLIAQSDEDFTFEMSSVFLDNISYFTNNQNFINPNSGWFSILESIDGLLWDWNNGVTDNIANGNWFGIVVMDNETWEAEINVPLITAIENTSMVNSYEIFPNPAIQQLNIRLSEAAQIILTDLTGQIVYKGFSKFKKIDLSGFNTGMYVVTVIYENYVVTEKVIIK